MTKNSSADLRRCVRCVMDTTDPVISFDSQGVCNHCQKFDAVTSKKWFPNEEGQKKLDTMFKKVVAEGKNKEYDCILGLSGGVDSSYLALIVKEYKLRPLVVHVDAGWNSELAVFNIEQLVRHCGFDLHTHVMPWDEVRDLQVSYLKAGVANQDAIQDHAFFASLYHFAAKENIRYVLSGTNIATECVFPSAWHHSVMDAINLRAIHKEFGSLPLQQYKTISFLSYFFYYPFVRRMTVLSPLDYIDFRKNEALQVLKETIGYKEYGRKHGESRFTKFFQNYYLPKKFGFDKRIAHLSSLILSGEISRDKALAELEKPLYDPSELREDKAYVAKKLGLSVSDLDSFTNSAGRPNLDFDSWDRYYKLMTKIRSILESLLGKKIKTY